MENKVLTIAKEVADYYGLTLNDINKKDRSLKYKEPRQMAHKLCWDLLPEKSMREIGLIIGQKSHGTVINSRKSIKRLMSGYSKVKNDYDFLYRKLEFRLKRSDPIKLNVNLRKQKTLIAARSASIRNKMPLRIELIVI